MSATRPGDESDEEGNEHGQRPSESPLDDLFVVGAKYHEPSAAEREAAAKAQDRANKKAMKEHDKEIARTRRVLGGDKSGRRHRREHDFSVASFERRTALLGFIAIIVISVALSFTAFGH